ncbi:MAG TPA: hypothetical protein VKA07_15795 [Candidatus Sulfotelmatobacter sp.]|nr:hypothetical protein [Candidatus Sulfotelmatobacter sp.]
MSEERRKRQQERESADQGEKTRTYLKWGGVLILLATAFAAGRYYRNHRYDSFAQCLASKQAKMYGLYWCPHCAEQKEMFGASFRYVPYVECAIKGSSEMAPECKIAGTKLFPSWQFGTNPPKEGVLSLSELADKTGCHLP